MATNTQTADEQVIEEAESKINDSGDSFKLVSAADLSMDANDVTISDIATAGDKLTGSKVEPEKENSFKKVSADDLSFDDLSDPYVESQRTIEGFDPGDYTKQLGTVYYNEAVDKSRALMQTTSDQLGNALGRIFVGGAADIISNIAAIGDIGGYAIGEGDKVGNEFTRWAQDLSDKATDAFPIYRVNPEESWNVGDAAWWIDNGSGVLRSAGAFLATGYATGGVLGAFGKLGKMMGASKNALNAYSKVSVGISAVAMNQAESMLDAVDTYDKIYQEYIDAGLGEEESRVKASTAAAHVVNTNRINIALNLTSASMFVKAPMMSQRIFNKSWGKKILRESAQEYMEEVVNFAASTRGEAAGYGLEKGIGSSISDAFFSKEGSEAGFWGAIGGAVQTGGAIALDSDGTRKNAALQESYIKQFDNDRSSSKKNSMFGVGLNMDVMTDIVTEMNKAYDNIQMAIDSGKSPAPSDIASYERNRTELLMSQSYAAFSVGAADNLKSYYKDIANMKGDQEVSDMFGEQYLDSSISHVDMANTALAKINEYEKIFNEVADIRYDKGKAYQHKVAINHSKDVEKTFMIGKEQSIKDLQENIVDVYFKKKGEPTQVVDYKDLGELSKTDPELAKLMVESNELKQIASADMMLKKIAINQAEQFEAFNKIMSDEHQKGLSEQSKNKGKDKVLTIEEAEKNLSDSLNSETSTVSDINKALENFLAIDDERIEDENIKAAKDMAAQKIKEIEEKNEKSFDDNGDSTKTPSQSEDPIDADKNELEQFYEDLTDDQITQRNEITDKVNQALSSKDVTYEQAKQTLKVMQDSKLFHDAEISNIADLMNSHFLKKSDETSEDEDVKKTITDKFYAYLENDNLSFEVIQAMLDDIAETGIFSKAEIKKLADDANDYLVKNENTENDIDNDIADKLEESLGLPEADKSVGEQIETVIEDETKGLSKNSKETVASATMDGGLVVSEEKADQVIEEVESRKKSTTNSKIVEAIKSIRNKIRKILAAIMIVAGSYFGIDSVSDAAQINDYTSQMVHTELIDVAVDNKMADDTVPYQEHAGGGSVLLMLAGLIRTGKKKKFMAEFKKHYPDADPEMNYNLMSKQLEEIKAQKKKNPQRINITQLQNKVPIKRNVEQTKKDLLGAIKDFSAASSLKKTLNDLSSALTQGLEVGGTFPIGEVKDADGMYMGSLMLTIVGDKANINIIETDSNGTVKKTIPIESMSIEEFLNRANKGYILNDVSKNKINFEADMISSENKASDDLADMGLDPESAGRDSDPEKPANKRDIPEEKQEKKSEKTDKKLIDKQIDNEPTNTGAPVEVNGVVMEGHETDEYSQKDINRKERAHLPKSWGGHVMGKVHPKTKKFAPLYDQSGSLVESEYIDGNTKLSVFDRLYSKDPDMTVEGMFFLGKEDFDDYRKNGNVDNAYYRMTRGPKVPATAKASEIFATNEAGQLLINTPEIKLGDKVTLIEAPENWRWFISDKDKIEKGGVIPILIYRSEDIVDGDPVDGALPLDMLATYHASPNESMRGIRQHFFDSLGPMELTISSKDQGYLNYSRAGDLKGGRYKLSARDGAYERNKKGKSEWAPSDKLKRRLPIIGIKRTDGSIDVPDGSPLVEGEQDAIDDSEINFAPSEKNEKDAGTPVMLIPTSNGNYMYSRLLERRLSNSEKEYVIRNMSSLLRKELAKRFEYQKDSDDFLRTDSNYVEGLSEVVPTNYIGQSARQGLATGEAGFASLYKEGAVNFTERSVIIKKSDGNYIELPFTPRPSSNPKVKALLPSPLDMIMEGPALEWKEEYNRTGDDVNTTVWVEELPNEKPMYLNVDEDGNFLSKSGSVVLPEKTYLHFGSKLAGVIRQNFFGKFDELRRNVLIKDGERQLLNDENTPFVDPVTPDITYDSYMDFLNEKIIVQHDVNPNKPINGAMIYLQNEDSPYLAESDPDPNAPLEISDIEQNNDIKYTDPKPAADPIQSSRETGKITPVVNVDEVTQVTDEQSDLVKRMKELDPKGDAARFIAKKKLDPNNPKDARKIERVMKSMERLTSKDEVAKGDYEAISEFELGWMNDNFESRTTVVKELDHVKSQGKLAWGYYFDGMATVAQLGKEGTAYHEAFHLVFDLGLNQKQKERLMADASKKYAGREQKYSDKGIGFEEFMADDFMDYMMKRERGEIKPKGRIQQYFEHLIYMIKNALGLRNSMESLFEQIAAGGYKSKLKDSNSWKRTTAMNNQIIPYRAQDVAVNYLKSNISNILRQVNYGIEKHKDDKKYTGPKDVDSWVRKYSQNLFDKLISYDKEFSSEESARAEVKKVDDAIYGERNGKHIVRYPTPQKGKIVEDHDSFEALFDSDAFDDLSDAEADNVTNMVTVLSSVMDHWMSDFDDLGNERSGFKSYVVNLLNSAGIPVKLGAIDIAGKDVKSEMSTTNDAEFEQQEVFLNQSEEDSKDHIHDQPIYFLDTKHSLDKRVKSWLFFTPVYVFNKDGAVEQNKFTNDKLIAKDEITGAFRTINFDRVYNKLKNLLANKSFNKMVETMQSMSLLDDEIASIWEAIKDADNTESNMKESFFSHFHMDKKNMMMIMDEGFGKFKIIDSNSKTLSRQLANQWKANASFYSPSLDMNTVIDKNIASKIFKFAGNFKKWYNGQALTTEAKERLKDETYQKQLIEQMIQQGDQLMSSMGIDVDNVIWEDMKERDFKYAHTKLSQLFFGKVTKSSKSDKGKARKEESVYGLAEALTKSIDIFTDKGTTIKIITDFVKNSILDEGSTSFINVDGKTVYSVNMNNNLSLLMDSLKGENSEAIVEEFKKDGFYQNNLFLDSLESPEFQNRLSVFYLDGMRNEYSRMGSDYSQSSTAQSIQTRLAAFFSSGGKYTLVNSGTKSDKSQSLYTRVMRLSSISTGMSYMDVAKKVMKDTVNQERSRIALVEGWKRNPGWVKKFGQEGILTLEDGKFKGTGDRFNYIPGLNAHKDMIPLGNDTKAFSKDDPKLVKREELENEEITKLLDMVVEEGLEEMYNNGIIGKENGEYIAYEFKKHGKQSPTALGSKPRAKATEFIINEFIWNLEMSKVFMGDLAGYKYNEKEGSHVTDYMKRAYQLITPGKSVFDESSRADKTSFESVIIGDIIKVNDFETVLGYARFIDKDVDEKYVRKLYNLKNKNPKDSLAVPSSLDMSDPIDRRKANVISTVDNFYDANKTDAQSYSNIEWYKHIMQNSQEWDNSHTFMYNKYWKDDAEIFAIMKKENRTTFTEKELKEIADGPKIEPLKPFYYGHQWSDEHSKIIHEQQKNSVFVITRLMAETFDEVSEGYNYRSLYNTLTGTDKKVKWKDNKRLILHDSAVKVGAYGKANYETDSNFVVRKNLMSNLRFPQVINSHTELVVNSGAQFPKMTTDNVQDSYEGYVVEGLDRELNGLEAKSLLSGVWNEKIGNSEKQLAEDLGLDEEFTMPDTYDGMLKFLTKVRDILRRSITDRDIPDNQIEAIDLVKTIDGMVKFKMPLDFPAIGNKYENLIATLFRNNILRQKLHGDSMAQLADFGTKTSDELKFLRRENGEIKAAEIGVPARIIRKIIGKDMPLGKIDYSKLSEEQKKALMIIGYRIPTQSKSSMLPLIITRILPDTYGASIMVPGEISVQQGSDYDIDKMFLIMRHYDAKEKELVKFNDPVKKGKYKKGANTNKQLDNFLFNLTWGIINSDNNNGEMFSPLDSKSFVEIKEYYSENLDGKPLEHNRVSGEKALFEKKRDNHISAFHTNIASEDLNKFAKIAVGILGLASTGKAYYTDIKAAIRLKRDKKTDQLITKDAVFIETNSKDTYRTEFRDFNDDGKLVTDMLKGLGNAALDNAKDPLLGYLDINMTTINPALLLNALGYSEKVIFDFMKQPIVRAISKTFGNFVSNDLDMAINTMMSKEMPAQMKDAYKLAKDKYKKGTAPVKIVAADLESYLGEPINNTSKQSFIDAQAKILVSFVNMYHKGNSLSALNKRLSPERQAKMNGHAWLYKFDAASNQASSHLEYENFTSSNAHSPTGRIAAFYKTINTYKRFAGKMFVTYSKSYGNIRAIMNGLTSHNRTRPGEFNTMTGAISYMLLAKHSDGFKSLIGEDSDVRKMFFNEDGGALSDTLVELKNDPSVMNQPLLTALDISFFNDYRYLKQIVFNNSTDRTVGEKNAIQDSWKSMLQSKNPKVKKFAEDLVPFFILSSGLDLNFNTAHEYIPFSFWADSKNDYIGYWERTSASLINNVDILTPNDIMNAGIQYARSHQRAIPTVSVNFDKKDGEFVSGKLDNAEDKKLRLDSGVSNVKNLETYDKVTLNRQNKKALNKYGKFVPFIKYNVSIKSSNGKKVSKLSGFRLLALVDLVKDEDGNHLNGVYQEVQWLGNNEFNETDLSKVNPRSIHPSNAKTDSYPSEGYYFEKGDDQYNKAFGISLVESDLDASRTADDDSNDLKQGSHESTTDESSPEETYYSLGDSVVSEEEVSQEVRGKINEFLEGIGVSTEVNDKLEEKYGLGVNAAANISNRTIEVADGKSKWKDLPEEAAHFYVEGLAGYEEVALLIKRAKKDPLYKEVYDQYGELYNYDEERIARETAAKLIARHLIKNEPVSKNWLRNVLNKFKNFVEGLFRGKDPFKVAANNILTKNHARVLNEQIDNDVMFALKVHPINIQNIGEETDVSIDMDKLSEHNKKRLNRVLKSIKSDIGRRKKTTRDTDFKNKLIILDSMLNIDQGLKFIDNYSVRAFAQASSAMKVLDSKTNNDELGNLDKINYLRKNILNWLSAYDHITELTELLINIYKEQGVSVRKSHRFDNLLKAGELVNVAKQSIYEKERQIFADELSKFSDTGETDQQIYDSLLITTEDIGILDYGIKSLSDTNDSLIGKIARIIRVRMKMGESNFLNYLRGTDDVGAAQATKDYIASAGTSNLKALYDPMMIYDKEDDRYRFIDEDNVNKLTAPQQKFYNAVILPYIKHRRKLHANGLKGVIGNPLNVPQIKKGTFESKSLSTISESVKDTFRMVENEDDYNRTDAAGNVLHSIRMLYQGGVKSNEVSMDIAQVVAMSMENLLYADSMSEIEQFTNVALHILKNRRLVPKDSEGNPIINETIAPFAPDAVKKFEALRNAIFYGEREKGYNKALFGVADTRKISEVVRKTVSYSNLAFNIFAQIVNPIVMGFFSLSKAIGGRDYTFKDWAKSTGNMFGNAAGMMKDFNSRTPTSKQSLIMERVGVFSHGLKDIQLSSKASLGKNFLTKLGYSGFKLGNAMVQPLTAEAYMRHQKITLKNGEEISMYDSYEKNGSSVRVRKDVLDAIGEKEFLAKEIAVAEMVRSVSDNEGLSDMSVLQQKWWGKFVMMHRSWMVPMMENLYGAVRPDNITGKMRGGTWYTSFSLLRKALSSENRHYLRTMFGHAYNAKPGDLDPFTNKPFTDDSLELYRSNFKQFMFHITTMITLTLIGALADNDDEKLSKAQKMAQLLRLRFLAEISSMINPGDIYRVLKHPTAAITYMDNIGKLLKHSINWSEASDVLKGGRYKGDTKFIANIKRLMPFEKQFSKFEDIDSLIEFYK